MMVSVWRVDSDWCVASTLLSRSLHSVLGSTPEPPLNHAGLGHLATSRTGIMNIIAGSCIFITTYGNVQNMFLILNHTIG